MSDDEPVDLLREAEEPGRPTDHRWDRMHEWLDEPVKRSWTAIGRGSEDGITPLPTPPPMHSTGGVYHSVDPRRVAHGEPMDDGRCDRPGHCWCRSRHPCPPGPDRIPRGSDHRSSVMRWAPGVPALRFPGTVSR